MHCDKDLNNLFGTKMSQETGTHYDMGTETLLQPGVYKVKATPKTSHTNKKWGYLQCPVESLVENSKKALICVCVCNLKKFLQSNCWLCLSLFLSSPHFPSTKSGQPLQQAKHSVNPGKNGNQGLLIPPAGPRSPGHVRGLWKTERRKANACLTVIS